jgi:hypothetical protein
VSDQKLKAKSLSEAMELIRQQDPDMLLHADLHNCLGLLRQATYLLNRGVVTEQEDFARRLIEPVVEFLETLDQA